jgi:hypothetical protein
MYVVASEVDVIVVEMNDCLIVGIRPLLRQCQGGVIAVFWLLSGEPSVRTLHNAGGLLRSLIGSQSSVRYP